MAASSSQHHEYENLPPPYRLIHTVWDPIQVREACKKSRAALEGLKPLSLNSSDDHDHHHHHHQFFHHLIQVPNVQNLFLMSCRRAEGNYGRIEYWDYSNKGEEEREWGSRDMMLDFGGATPEQRLDYLRAAAHFNGGAVYLILQREDVLSEQEMIAWVEALSDAAESHDKTPRILLIKCYWFDPYDTLNALKKSKGLLHLSLQGFHVRDEGVEVLSHFTSLTTLHLDSFRISPMFVGKLADLHPSHSPLAASLQRLAISTDFIDWSGGTGFLQNWPHLKELTLYSRRIEITNEQIIEWMYELAPSLNKKKKKKQKKMKERETAGSTPAASSSTDYSVPTDPRPRLYSLSIHSTTYAGRFKYTPPRSVIAVVMDAVCQSNLPFLELNDLEMDPAIKAQLERNRRTFKLGDLRRVPAKSMRLFICGDAYAGKTTLLSTMHSIYPGRRKRDKLRATIHRLIQATAGRTEGIEVRAMERKGVRLSLWDMAGQPEFHAFHDCMLPDIGSSSSYQAPSLFMFVWSPVRSQNREPGHEEIETQQEFEVKKTQQEFEVSLRYWLKFLASKSRKSNTPLRVILVFTHADQMNLIAAAVSNTIASLRSEFKEVIQIEDTTFEVDARKRGSVKSLSEHIFGIAEEMLQDVLVYDICTQVSEHLSNHLKATNQRIITWSKFSEISKPSVNSMRNDDKGKLDKILEGIALSLNESGIIIYVHNKAHIVLDPNWFCNKIMGSLIHFPNCKKKLNIMDINGFANRRFLEGTLQLATEYEVKESLLVDLMEAMHLCCKVQSNPDMSTTNEDDFFIPTTLTLKPITGGLFGGMDQQLQWRPSDTASTSDGHNPLYVYMGRRLECENKNLTFLTPGLFPRIQVEFHNVFKEEKDFVNINLGKDFISIFLQNMDIVVVFCKAKSDHVIDVLARATNSNTQQLYMEGHVDYLQENVINRLITICAQPTGIQGVNLIENVIRPDSFHDPSKAEHREDQCMEITTLKEILRRQLEQGKGECYTWMKTEYIDTHTTNSFIDILGSKNYSEVVMSYKAWLEEVNDILVGMDDVNRYGAQHQSHRSVTMTTSELCSQHLDMQDEDCKRTAMAVKRALEPKFDSMKKMFAREMLSVHKKLDEIHRELKGMREDVVRKVEKAVDKLLKFVVESEAEKQLPRLAILTSDGVNNVRKLVTKLSGGHISSLRIQLCCEHRKSPHLVEKQPGINITSLSEEMEKALPYINGLAWILITVAKLGISSVIPMAGVLIPDSLRSVTEALYPIISNIGHRFRDDMPATSSSSIRFKQAHVWPTILQSSEEWQKFLASILQEKYGGATDKIIYDKFLLRRATEKEADGNIQVSWLCGKHYA